MHGLVTFAGTVLMGFFAMMNPIATTPLGACATVATGDEGQRFCFGSGYGF